jgi:hypothetical protein
VTSNLSHLEETLRQHNAANFIEAVTGALDTADGRLLLTLRAFYREPELLYTALTYASARGATVVMAPERDNADQMTEFSVDKTS